MGQVRLALHITQNAIWDFWKSKASESQLKLISAFGFDHNSFYNAVSSRICSNFHTGLFTNVTSLCPALSSELHNLLLGIIKTSCYYRAKFQPFTRICFLLRKVFFKGPLASASREIIQQIQWALLALAHFTSYSVIINLFKDVYLFEIIVIMIKQVFWCHGWTLKQRKIL